MDVGDGFRAAVDTAQPHSYCMVQRKRKHNYMIMQPNGTEYERRGQNIPKYESMKHCAMVELGFTPGY